MKEMLLNLLLAVITAAVPVITTYAVGLISKAKDEAVAKTDDIKVQGYIREIAGAITRAVAATSQTYVDSLKKAGKFDAEAQMEAANKAMTACLASISPAATEFIESVYGDAKAYLLTMIEAEVRKQKNEAPVELSAVSVLESPVDTTAVAASTAGATAATIAQTAIQQINAESPVQKKE